MPMKESMLWAKSAWPAPRQNLGQRTRKEFLNFGQKGREKRKKDPLKSSSGLSDPRESRNYCLSRSCFL